MSEAVAEVELTQEDIENQLPVPVGYRVLVAYPKLKRRLGNLDLLNLLLLLAKNMLCRLLDSC